MNTPLLNKQEIYTIPIERDRDGKEYLIYAPLTGVCLSVSKEELFRLEHSSDFANDEQVQSIYRQLSSKPVKGIKKTETIEETSELSILLNYICNFSCSYCYSAKGRSGKAISKDKLFTALNFFIDRERVKTNKLRITFSGGGDPLMSKELLRETILYSAALAKEQGFTIQYGIVTNGTLLNQEIIDLVTQYNIDLVISFDVLEEVHSKQRDKYKAVCDGINYLISHDIYPGIRSTITPLNVCRMEEMVNEMITRFPALGGMALEAVLNPSLFNTSSELEQFYNDFITHYFKAYELGIRNNFYAGNTIINDIKELKERACLSKFTLTPEGDITACSRISSPKEDFFEPFNYGCVTKNGVEIVDEKLNGILGKNLHHYPQCQACVAKWHCSGGCLLARYAYTPEYFEVYCRFMRNMLREYLLVNR